MPDTNQSHNERRNSSRVVFQAEARIIVSGQAMPCRLRDLSLKGALIEQDTSSTPLALGDACTLELELCEDHSAVIRMSGEVAHIEDKVLGVQCREIDLDSITLLRRLLELNLGDSSLLDRELSALVSD
jgi:hypothetical protein